jgi:hypothetical protein
MVLFAKMSGFLGYGLKNVAILNLKIKKNKNVLLVAPRFDLEVDFMVSVHKDHGCQGHRFKQLVMLTLKKRGCYYYHHFSFWSSILWFLFGTVPVIETMISTKL